MNNLERRESEKERKREAERWQEYFRENRTWRLQWPPSEWL